MSVGLSLPGPPPPTPQLGVLNVHNGSMTYAGGGLACNWGLACGQVAIINMLGGSVANTAAVPLNFNFDNSRNTGILNLLGGSFQAEYVTGGATARINFNGGTLAASQSYPNFINASVLNVYSGGAILNNNGNQITNADPLVAPAGNGVNGIASFTAGAGYIAPPIVIISGGGGAGATAIAQIDTTPTDANYGESDPSRHESLAGCQLYYGSDFHPDGRRIHDCGDNHGAAPSARPLRRSDLDRGGTLYAFGDEHIYQRDIGGLRRAGPGWNGFD